MRYVFDTEFWERGSDYPIIPISIGIVSEDGRELYCVNKEAPIYEISTQSEWLSKNVLPRLHRDGCKYRSRREIAQEILKLIGDDPEPEFWAYFADYDWVVLCQLFGTMIQLPRHLPMWCRDVKQLMEWLKVKKDQLPKQKTTEHNALNDALWTKEALDYLFELKDQTITIPKVEEHYHDITKKKCRPDCPWEPPKPKAYSFQSRCGVCGVEIGGNGDVCNSCASRAVNLSHGQGTWYNNR